MKALPFILILVVFLGANFYVFYRLWNMMPANVVGRTLLVVFGVAAVSSIFIYFLLGNSLSALLSSIIYRLGTSWIFIFLYMLMAMLVLDLLRVTHLLPLEKYMYNSWLGFGVVVGLVAIIMIGGNIKYHNKTRVDLPLTLNKATANGDPLKIVAISDMHLGYGIGKGELDKWIELINKEEPDVVLIAGDIIDNNVKPLYEQSMQEEFLKIKSRYGVYACAGNHEYIANISQSLNFLDQTNVNLLKDSVVLIDNSFYIIGRDDRMNLRRKSVEQLTAGLDRSKPIIMLDHQPYHLEEAEKNGIDLQISGHTHRGQVWPITWITDAIYEVSHGYKKKGNTNIYVSSGIGLWGGKFRIGSQSEYVVISLNP